VYDTVATDGVPTFAGLPSSTPHVGENIMGMPNALQHGLLVVQIRAVIEYAIQTQAVVNYLPLAKSLGVFSGGKQLALALASIMEEDHRDGRPLTCALVISSVKGMPGDGFFVKARSLGYQMPYGEDRFWKSQCQALGVTP